MLVHPKSTKDQILGLLKTSGRLSIGDIANHFNLTDMAVRRHIQSLERDQLIETIMIKQTKGRPSKLYQLSQTGDEKFPKRYKQLSIELLQELKAVGQESLITELLLRRKNRLIEKYMDEKMGNSFNEKLAALKEIQSEEGYMPEIIEENGVFHFKEYNCPYIDTAKEFKQICTSEKELIKEFLQTDAVEIASCMTKGDRYCHYKISPK